MANVFLKPEVISATALGLLRRELILPRLVSRLGATEFRGAQNDTVNVKVPRVLDAREYAWRNNRASPIVVDELQEETIPVVLNHNIYSAIAVTDEELTMDIVSFATQVLQPQILAVAERLEGLIATAMVGATYADAPVVYTPGTPDQARFYAAAVQARRILNDRHIPMAGRFIALGSEVEAAALLEDSFRKVDESGSNEALREAVIGRVAGFTVIGNVQSLPGDFAIAAHASAFAFANVTPEVPAGVAAGAATSFDGLAMRWIRDYDTMFLRDRSVVSSFAGANSVDDARDDHGELSNENQRAVLIDFQAAS